jgi:hypothetical protein
MATLPGTWLLHGHPFLTLEPDGTGVMEGESFRWRVEGNTLLIDADGLSERAPFQLAGDVLVVQLGGVPLQLVRARLSPSSPRAGATPPPRRSQAVDERAAALQALAERIQAPGAGSATAVGGDPLSALLTSSSWCWMEYRGGNSSSGKLHFGRDGTWQEGSESELYSNNPYLGSTAHLVGNHSNGGRWEVRQGQLFMSSPQTGGQLVPIALTVTRNSNGAPILVANGREYCSC